MSQHILGKSQEAVTEALSQAASALNINKGEFSRLWHKNVDKKKVYVDPTKPSPPSADGSQSSPYGSIDDALSTHKGQDIIILTRKGEEAEKGEGDDADWQRMTDSAMKKAKKNHEALEKKLAKKAEQDAKQAELQKADQAKMEASKAIVLEEPKGEVERIKIRQGTSKRGKLVRIFGWVHRLRAQKGMYFIVLRDGTGYLQCILSGKLIETYDALTLQLESTIQIVGEIKPVPEGQNAPDGHELVASWWSIVGKAPGGDEAITTLIAPDSDPSILANNRHLTIRGENASSVLRVRAALLAGFRKTYQEMGLLEVTPPCMVQTQCEGGASLFDFNYYGQTAYLTQSSQLYLETCLPSLGDVFCVQESFRAENSHTRRHLSEFTHLEAELAFLTFDDLMSHIEELICRTLEHTLSDPKVAAMVEFLNRDAEESGRATVVDEKTGVKKEIRQVSAKFVMPSRPFMRFDYRDAIKWLKENGIKKEDGTFHEVGDDIAEAAERQMTDKIGKPIFLTKFPKDLKAFYMKRIEGDEEFTESCDLLMPGVGEIIGGSMRIADLGELMEGYKREGIDPEPYYWFTDQRKYGTCEHGGYGLGVERFLAWLTRRWTVRECCLYPRWPQRATP